MTIYEFVGWVGAVLFIMAYLLLTLKILKSDKIPYQLMNMVGGLCLVINSYKINDDPNFLLNFIWMCIGVFAISGIIRTKK